MTVEEIAQVCHEANKAICEANGDHSQPDWDEAPDWVRESAVAGVLSYIKNPAITPQELHNAWCQQKLDDGWHYGINKDAVAKTHPCLVAYRSLPADQRVKDHVFRAIAGILVAKMILEAQDAA